MAYGEKTLRLKTLATGGTTWVIPASATAVKIFNPSVNTGNVTITNTLDTGESWIIEPGQIDIIEFDFGIGGTNTVTNNSSGTIYIQYFS